MLVDMCLLNLIKELCNTTHCQRPKAIRIEKVLYKKANNSKFKVMSYKKWETNVILLILRRGEGGAVKSVAVEWLFREFLDDVVTGLIRCAQRSPDYRVVKWMIRG